jgi:hypothetical protein
MKLIKHLSIYIFTLLTLTNTFGGVGTLTGGSKNGMISRSDNWSKILKTVRSKPELKTKGDYAYVGQIVSLFDVCTDGRNFITKNKLPVYQNVRVPKHKDNDGEKDGYTDIIVGHEHRTYPLNTTQTKKECNSRDKNCRYVEKDFIQETEKDITIYKHMGTQGSQDRDIYKKLFKKKYHVPNCRK